MKLATINPWDGEPDQEDVVDMSNVPASEWGRILAQTTDPVLRAEVIRQLAALTVIEPQEVAPDPADPPTVFSSNT